MQQYLFIKQIQLASDHHKSLIIHSREAVDEVIDLLTTYWHTNLTGRAVFHCCEPDKRLLSFAQKQHLYIGVDGDITYNKKKQEFIKTVPLNMLVLETDSPYLLPEPLKSRKEYPNEPKNISIILSFISRLLPISKQELEKQTDENARRLFALG
jgi:TatD DNase family protein